MTAQYIQDLVNAIPLSPWVIGPVIAIFWLAILLPARKTLLARSHRYLHGRTHWAWADSLIEALAPASGLIIIAGAIALLAWILPLNPRAELARHVILVGAV